MGGIHLTTLAETMLGQSGGRCAAGNSCKIVLAQSLMPEISTDFSPHLSAFLLHPISHNIIANKFISTCSFKIHIIPIGCHLQIENVKF